MSAVRPFIALLPLAAVFAQTGCRRSAPVAEVPVQRETPADAITRIGTVWEASLDDKGFKSPPSKLAVFRVQQRSQIKIRPSHTEADEELFVIETYDLRDGSQIKCESATKLTVQVRFGRKDDEPALSVTRPPFRVARHCTPLDPPETAWQAETGEARFVLRGDQLAPFAPALEKRVYLPLQ